MEREQEMHRATAAAVRTEIAVDVSLLDCKQQEQLQQQQSGSRSRLMSHPLSPRTAEGGEVDLMSRSTTLLDLDPDCLIQCCHELTIQDLSRLALTCRRLRELAYSEPLWNIHCKKRWFWSHREGEKGKSPFGNRDVYMAYHNASQQLRFKDPAEFEWVLERTQSASHRISHLLLDEDCDTLTVVEGPTISVWNMDFDALKVSLKHTFHDHNSNVTSIRSIPSSALPQARGSGIGRDGHFLLSASSDHTIHLWGKNRSMRTFRGHTAGVNTLADRLLGTSGFSSTPVMASGGEDTTVRIWNLSARGKGVSPLLATLWGHEGPVVALCVARHNSGLLVSAAKDCKLRLWDTNVGTCSGSAGCLGTMRGPGQPKALHCEGSIAYIAGGSGVSAVDLRLMKSVATVAVHDPATLVLAFCLKEMAMCTGASDGTVRLWDMRRESDYWPQPVAVLPGHAGPVECVHLDSYKVVTAGPSDMFARVCDTKTGDEISVLSCCGASRGNDLLCRHLGIGALMVRGTMVVTGSRGYVGTVCAREFAKCTPVQLDMLRKDDDSSKFWTTSPDH